MSAALHPIIRDCCCQALLAAFTTTDGFCRGLGFYGPLVFGQENNVAVVMNMKKFMTQAAFRPISAWTPKPCLLLCILPFLEPNSVMARACRCKIDFFGSPESWSCNCSHEAFLSPGHYIIQPHTTQDLPKYVSFAGPTQRLIYHSKAVSLCENGVCLDFGLLLCVQKLILSHSMILSEHASLLVLCGWSNMKEWGLGRWPLPPPVRILVQKSYG